jgi:hypothetical protein
VDGIQIRPPGVLPPARRSRAATAAPTAAGVVATGLGRPVDEVGLAGPDRSDRGQHHDGAVALNAHPRSGREQRGDVSSEVGLDQQPGAERITVQDLLPDQDACGGDDQVHVATGEGLIDEGLVSVQCGRVEAQRPGRDTQLLGGRRHPLLVPAGQQHLGARGQPERGQDLQADLTGPAEQQHPGRAVRRAALIRHAASQVMSGLSAAGPAADVAPSPVSAR